MSKNFKKERKKRMPAAKLQGFTTHQEAITVLEGRFLTQSRIPLVKEKGNLVIGVKIALS